MKIAYVTPGTGGTFYCQNCIRDSELSKELIGLGHEVIKVQMYLPSGLGEGQNGISSPIFFGAINLYLKEKLPLYRHAPMWLERFFDAPTLLQMAAKKSGSMKASGLEEMTISMLQGEEGRQASELDQLIDYLKTEIRPDVVHLSNSLLLGIARRLKRDLGAGVVCSLQDEDEWIDLMDDHYQKKVWNIMGEKAADVDVFITASNYYRDKSKKQLGIQGHQMEVIPGGINLEGYETSSLPFDPPVIGYLRRMSEYFGLSILVEAFIKVKRTSQFKNLKLHVTGGYTGEDKKFVAKLLKTISQSGFENDVTIFKAFDKENRIKFLKSLTLLSVPIPGGEAFCSNQAEALAAGVPVVQPNVGCYPEFVEDTCGGMIYEPNDSNALAKTIVDLLSNPDKVRTLGRQGQMNVLKRYSMSDMAKSMTRIYEKIVSHTNLAVKYLRKIYYKRKIRGCC